MGRRAALVCLLIAVGGARARADDQAFPRILSAAVHLFETLDYEDALDQLMKAKRLSRGPDDDVAVALYEGLIRLELHQQSAAEDAFRVALFLNPNATLPIKVAPKVSALFEEVRVKVKKEIARGGAIIPAPAPPPTTAATPAPAALPRVESPPPAISSTALAWIPAGAGVVLAGVGTVFLWQANQQYQQLEGGVPAGNGAGLRDAGKLNQTLGVVGLAAGGAALAGAAVWALLGGSAPERQAMISVSSNGAFVGLSGRFP